MPDGVIEREFIFTSIKPISSLILLVDELRQTAQRRTERYETIF
jgi:hypothetical protein